VQVTANGNETARTFHDRRDERQHLTWEAPRWSRQQESEQEMTVVANSYSAEDGRNSGAQIKVVSKSGTNSFTEAASSNSIAGLQRLRPMGWPGRPESQKDRTNLRQFGGSVGGPGF